MHNRLVIVGSGLGAYMLLQQYRKQDADREIVIITQHKGDFYSKPQLSTALSKQKLPDALILSTAATMEEKWNITLMTQTKVVSIDRENKVVQCHSDTDGEGYIAYQQLVLATGAHTIQPALTGDAVEDVISVNDLESYAVFRERLSTASSVAILGAGLVGCEIANDLVSANFAPTIIAPESYPLARLLPKAVGKALELALTEANVKWRLGRMATAVKHADNGYSVVLDDGTHVQADLVLSAVGLRPNVDIAKDCGLAVDHGIVVDHQLRTSCKDIFALGDCAKINGEIRMYVAPILESAKVLSRVLMEESATLALPVMPIILKTPSCPMVLSVPAKPLKGSWTVSGEGKHLKAIFHDSDGYCRGYVLTGDRIREKMACTQMLGSPGL